jgi:TRAP-type mannitol/chloroaromatic compound transport system permease small subunit
MADRFFSAAGVYVRWVDALNRKVGRFAMIWLFGLLFGILTYAILTDVILQTPANWAMEMAQFTMAAYYILGGGFSLQNEAHVRVDLLYGRWSPLTRARVDVFTSLLLMFYLGILLVGGFQSVQYALEYNQKNFTAWGPPLAPVKIIIFTGILLMFLQTTSIFLKSLAHSLRRELP